MLQSHRRPVIASRLFLLLLLVFQLQRSLLAQLLRMRAVVPVDQFIKRLTLALKFSTCMRKLFT